MKIILTGEHGTREIATKADLIRDQLAALTRYANDGRVPTQHLLKDIACYEFILGSEDPEKKADEYFAAKMKMHDQGVYPKNFEIAEMLGWKYL